MFAPLSLATADEKLDNYYAVVGLEPEAIGYSHATNGEYKELLLLLKPLGMDRSNVSVAQTLQDQDHSLAHERRRDKRRCRRRDGSEVGRSHSHLQDHHLRSRLQADGG